MPNPDSNPGDISDNFAPEELISLYEKMLRMKQPQLNENEISSYVTAFMFNPQFRTILDLPTYHINNSGTEAWGDIADE
jgi:hypothetical protein